MNNDDLKRKIKKGIALFIRFIKNPAFVCDDFFQFEFEKKMGITTRGFVKESELGIPLDLNPYHYVPGGNVYLKKVLKRLRIKETDSIIDLGCGLGSPMLYMSKFPFKKISGVEFSKELYLGCKKNFEKLNYPHVSVLYGDAGDFNSFDEYNYIFMFNPFGLVTMKRVLENINQSYAQNPRIITLIYKNPLYGKEVLETEIFHKISEYKTESSFKFFVYRTNI
ncbi:MAG: class I SAM-dependent methyltransferase [Paludibacteraceae bacterium]|nr:class I SAM-dependent methyltransferase [Paludibacteraceae bacterium]